MDIHGLYTRFSTTNCNNLTVWAMQLTLGKGEVESSIPSSSTILYNKLAIWAIRVF